MNNKTALYTLHRYFIWADRMRLHFDTILQSRDTLDNESFQIESFLYMSYWYGGLYVLIEGWQELGLKDKKIDSLLSESENVNLLRRYRNGVFHFHKEYFDKKYTELISEGNNCVEWIRNLREAFSDFFLEIFNH